MEHQLKVEVVKEFDIDEEDEALLHVADNLE